MLVGYDRWWYPYPVGTSVHAMNWEFLNYCYIIIAVLLCMYRRGKICCLKLMRSQIGLKCHVNVYMMRMNSHLIFGVATFNRRYGLNTCVEMYK